MKRLLLTLVFAAAGAASINAQSTLVFWDFNNSTAGTGGAAGVFNTSGTPEIYNTTSETLAGARTGLMAAAATVGFSDLAGNMGGSANNNWGTFGGVASGSTAAGGALTVIGSGNNGHYVDFTFSTTGFSGINIAYDTRGTATGFTAQAWSYSVGGAFTDATAFTGRNVTNYGLLSFDLDEITNQPAVTLRLAFSGATSSSGNNRIDNFTVTGTAIPEPSTYAMILGGLTLSLVALRRRRA